MGLPDIPAGIEKKANDALAAFATSLADVQPGYKKTKGRYWQGIQCAAVPEDGAEIVPDTKKHPTDQAEDYDDLGVKIPAKSPCTFSVDVFDGTKGQGYQVNARLEIAKKTWRKTVGVGEYGASADWAEEGEING